MCARGAVRVGVRVRGLLRNSLVLGRGVTQALVLRNGRLLLGERAEDRCVALLAKKTTLGPVVIRMRLRAQTYVADQHVRVRGGRLAAFPYGRGPKDACA